MRHDLSKNGIIGSTAFKIASPEGFTAERRGDRVIVTGRVENTFEDVYDFDNEKEWNWLPNMAQDVGAQTYTYRMKPYGAIMESEFRINKAGELELEKSELKDLPPGLHNAIYGYTK